LGKACPNGQAQLILGSPYRCYTATAKLNSFLGALIGATPPPVRGGKQPKVYYATQAGIAPPKFVVFSNGWIEASYRRFIERRLREEFSFPGTPVQVAIRVKERE